MGALRVAVVVAAAAATAGGAQALGALGGGGDPRDAAAAGGASAVAAASKSATVKIKWSKDRGTRVQGSVPFIHRTSAGDFRLYYCSEGRIVSATSSDAYAFTPELGVRLAAGESGGYEQSVCDPSIVDLGGGAVRMYYKGAKGQGGPGQAVHKVFSALSSDGLTFEREGVRIDSESTGDGGWASVPEAMRLPDGRVRIYYVSADPAALGGTMSAVSSDGLTFTKERGARVKSLVDPAVLRLGKRRYLMLAVSLPQPPGGSAPAGSLSPGIYSLTSTDGVSFRDRKKVLRENGVYDPTIVKLSRRKLRVLYGKNTGTESQPNVVTKSLTGRLA